ncbi:YihY/virulence factor BrkB family protein [Paraburkholderia sp. MMS20-SJTN17]|uniref:YihY/virulence factor BrkB family protein n=1 Tax=Paraburkholderia translucens TaxID=2886945 RepID=A0ABS8KC77_9BURK|nr:YihY/virulence factor BrkB family protein [Paraburkholderia sp. MMS20-SJTN17]MCC8402310.1 YihY/virulence factor BrkB family protein [Paraburkholderia sp. MMS20-SJTN17]
MRTKAPPGDGIESEGRAETGHGARPGFVAVVRGAVNGFLQDRCATLSASIAFYSAFSLAPTLLIVLAIVGWFFGADAAQGRLFGQIKDITGPEAADAMQAIVQHAHRASGSGVAAALSGVLLIVGASATFSSLNTALDIIFKVESPKGISGLTLLLRARLASFGLVMGLGFLLVVSLVLDAAIQTVGRAVLGSVTLTVVAAIAQSIFALLVMTGGFGALIKWLPDVKVRLRPALIGGLVSAILFSVGRHLFGLYLAHAGTAGSFGAAGSLAVLMMWLYFSAAVFLIGAEVAACLEPARDADAQHTRTPWLSASRERSGR